MQHSSCPESGLHLCFPSRRLSRHTLQTSQWKDLSLWILSKYLRLEKGSQIVTFTRASLVADCIKRPKLVKMTKTYTDFRRILEVLFSNPSDKRLLCSKVRF